jgi:hypothetical protein
MWCVSASELFINFLKVQNMCASLNLVISFTEKAQMYWWSNVTAQRLNVLRSKAIVQKKKNQIEIFKKLRKHQGILIDIDFFLIIRVVNPTENNSMFYRP